MSEIRHLHNNNMSPSVVNAVEDFAFINFNLPESRGNTPRPSSGRDNQYKLQVLFANPYIFQFLICTIYIYIFIRQKGSSNKWKKAPNTQQQKQTNKREKTTLKSGGLVKRPVTKKWQWLHGSCGRAFTGKINESMVQHNTVWTMELLLV